MNYKLHLMYEGTHYAGWQRQQNAVTVQGELERVLAVLTRENLAVTGISRTDAGVHAADFKANFHTEAELDTRRLCRSLNALLPRDIRVTSVELCPDTFNARFDPITKTYLYRLDISEYGNVFYKNFSWHVPRLPYPDRMEQAASYFIGTHDFSAFMAQGSSAKTFTRTISESYIESHDEFLDYYITGNGFLYNMVRIITGTLVAVGKGKILPEEIPAIILSKDRTRAGMTAPPQGLTLFKAHYPQTDDNLNETE